MIFSQQKSDLLGPSNRCLLTSIHRRILELRMKVNMSKPTEKDIAKAQKNAMSPADVKEDMMLVLGPHMNWQEMLNPAPLSVCLLGQLVLVTLDKDVSLVSENMDRNQFELVKYPESLRTSIVQVANQGWTAFNCANKNMDQIRLLTLQVPQHVKNAVKFIIGGSNEEIEELVPDILSNIDRIANTCTEKAQEVEDKFTEVMELIGELQEACTLAKGQYDEKLRKAKAEKIVKSKRMEEAKASKQRAEEEYKDMKDNLSKARKSYEDAMDSFPSAGSMMGMKFLEDLGKAFTGTVGAVTSAATFRSLRKQKPTTAAEDDLLLSEVAKLDLCLKQLQEIYNRWLDGKTDEEMFDIAEASFKDVTDALLNYKGKAKKKLETITKDGLELIRLLSIYSKQMIRGENEKKTLEALSKRLTTQMEALHFICNITSGGSPMPNPTPKMAAAEQASSDTVTDAYGDQCRFKVEQASASLEAARQESKEMSKKLEEASEKVGNLIAELAAINLDEINFDEIKKLLQRGIKALGQVKTQWGKLVRFFQTMSNIIKCCMNENVKNFVQSAEKGKKFRLKYSLSDMLRDMIYTQASEANKIAFMVNNLSSMYVEVSEKHLMDQVACLGQLLALDPQTEKHAIVQKQLQLKTQAEEATKSIADIVQQKQHEFDTKVQKRIQKIETEMRAVLPPKPVEPEIEMERKKAIQEARDYKKETEEPEVDDWV